MGYVNYSDSQKSQAKETDMVDFLEKEEGFSFAKKGREWHCIEHDSLVINADKQRWYWNSQKIGGGNAIDYLTKIKHYNYPESMARLVGKAAKTNHYARASPNPEMLQPKELSLPKATDKQYKNVFAYLTQTRKLDSSIIQTLIDKKYIYQDEKNNAVYVGYDENKTAKFGCVRGTLTEKQYRGDCIGSDKKYAFKQEGFDKETVYVFEAPIDLLSHATMFNEATSNKKEWLNQTRLSLGGTSDVALEHYLSQHKDTQSIILCLDNDSAGQNASELIAKKYAEKGYTAKIMPPKTKDYNSDLVAFVMSKSEHQEKILNVSQGKIK